MPSSGYTAITFVASEQPTTAKWNLIGSNFESFRLGTALEDSVILDRHIAAANLLATKVSNPYKFHAQRTAAHTSVNAYTKIPFDTELFDTGGNFDSTTNRRFVAPVAGFYFFEAMAGNTVAGATAIFVSLYKNGVKVATGSGAGTAPNGQYCNVSALLQLAATDYVEAYFVGGNGSTMGVTADCHFSGFLVSAT